MSEKLILVVDDSRENLLLAEKQIGNLGYKVFYAPSFDIAVQLLKKYQFEIVLTDCIMPGEKTGVSSDNPEIGKDTPYGLVIAIMASNSGVENVCIVTDLENHHSGPIAWALDQITENSPHIKCVRKKDWLLGYSMCVKNNGMPLVETSNESFFDKVEMVSIAVSYSSSDKDYIDKMHTNEGIPTCDIFIKACYVPNDITMNVLNLICGNTRITAIHVMGDPSQELEFLLEDLIRCNRYGYKIIVSSLWDNDEFQNELYKHSSVKILRYPYRENSLRLAFEG